MCVWRCVCGEYDVFGFGGVVCLFLAVDVCDVFVFVVVCLLCVERERERRKREKKEREKKYGGRLATRSEILGQCETVPKSIGIVFN